jgi:hypothetical protein
MLNMKGNNEVESKPILPYLEGPSKKFMDKKQSTSYDTHTSCNNFDSETLLVGEASSPKYVHKRDHSNNNDQNNAHFITQLYEIEI